MGFLFFNFAYVPSLFYIHGLAGALATPLHCSYYDITYTFSLLLPLGLQAEVPAMSIPHIINSFGLYCLPFLLSKSIQHLRLPRPFCFSSILNLFHSLGILSPFHSLGVLHPFHPFLSLSFQWALAKSFWLPWLNYHILTFGFIGL